MDELTKVFVFTCASVVADITARIFTLLFMHYSAKHRNHKLSVGWYIFGLLFNLPTLIVFLIKRADFAGPDKKVCWQCNDRFPETFVMCPKCCIDLPVNIEEEKTKQKKLSRICGIFVIAAYIASFVIAILLGVSFEQFEYSVFDDFEYNYRISIDGLYYDKMGNSYENETDVLLYSEDGSIYTYTAMPSEVDVLSEDYFFVSEDGQKFEEYNCYVTSEGWFYYDEEGLITECEIDTSNMTNEEIDAIFNDFIASADEGYRYYNYVYSDADGNIYYLAYEASWNEKGELITAENDVTMTK